MNILHFLISKIEKLLHCESLFVQHSIEKIESCAIEDESLFVQHSIEKIESCAIEDESLFVPHSIEKIESCAIEDESLFVQHSIEKIESCAIEDESLFLQLPVEILSMIFDLLDLKSQLNMCSVSTFFKKFNITNFWNIEEVIESTKITEDILKKYPFIKFLNLCDNRIIKDINFLKHVTKLNISGGSLVSSEGIKNLLNLKYLNANNNNNITFLTNNIRIKYLVASGLCGLSDDQIKHLKLRKLYACKNNRISCNIE